MAGSHPFATKNSRQQKSRQKGNTATTTTTALPATHPFTISVHIRWLFHCTHKTLPQDTPVALEHIHTAHNASAGCKFPGLLLSAAGYFHRRYPQCLALIHPANNLIKGGLT